METTPLSDAMIAKVNTDAMEPITLSEAMIALADGYGLPDHHKMRVLARQFNDATDGYYADPPTHTQKRFIGAWTRARKAWCEFTGDPLI